MNVWRIHFYIKQDNESFFTVKWNQLQQYWKWIWSYKKLQGIDNAVQNNYCIKQEFTSWKTHIQKPLTSYLQVLKCRNIRSLSSEIVMHSIKRNQDK